MSSATVRPKRRQDGYQFTNSNQSHNSRTKKWNNNNNNVNMTPRNQPTSPQSPVNNNHHTPISNNTKTVETVHDEVATEHMHDRLMFLLVNFVGMNVSVTVKSGAKYQGLFKSASTKGELGVVLKMARKVTKADEKNAQNRVIPTYLIMPKDLVEIHACGVDFSACDRLHTDREVSGFRTDADISGRSEIRERELHKWTPDESGEGMKGLEDDINSESGGNGSWDQFAVNEQLFGIKTDFNEEIYTTKLDRSGADFKERERQAIAIANEITRSSTTNPHLLEERGIIPEESQMDEEDRYGAVVRNRDPNKYMPPQLRKLQEQQLQNGSVPAVKKPEPTKEPIKEVKIKPTEETKPTKQTQPLPTTTAATTTTTTTTTTSTITTAAAAATTTPPATATTQKIPPFSSSSSLTQLPTRKTGVDAEGKPIEDQIVKTFRQFATNEKERLQQRMQAIKKKEMDVKVDELRKWRQTFKLNFPLPQDILPIMTKDKTKQQQLTAESVTALTEKEKDKDSEKQKDKDKAKEKPDREKEKEKQQEKDKDKDKPKEKDSKPKERAVPTISSQNLETKLKPEIKVEEDKTQKTSGDSTESKSTSDKTSDKPIPAADKAPGRTTASSSNNSQFKLNVKANEWKPNPNAASFTPITPNTQDKRSPGSSPFFVNRQLKKNTATLRDGFNPFQKGKGVANPSSIPPTWPFGQRPFRHQFTVTNNYEEDIYSQSAVTQGFGFAYPVAGPYRGYPPNQFVGVPPIPIQQGAPIPYMQPGFVPGVPFTTTPMPPTGAPPMYSAQLPSVIPQHFGSQGYPSPGRTPMVPATMHPQIYQPYQNPHAMPPMMRFPHDMVHVPGPNGVMIGQRPVMMEPHYVQPEAAQMGMPVSEPTTTQ